MVGYRVAVQRWARYRVAGCCTNRSAQAALHEPLVDQPLVDQPLVNWGARYKKRLMRPFLSDVNGG